MAKAESITMMRKMAATTAEVVADPTASAPPLTWKPLWHPMPEMSIAKTTDLIMLFTMEAMVMTFIVSWM
jgi:hypothetical protein